MDMGGAPTLRDDKSRQTDSPDGQNPFIFSDGRFGHRAFSLPDRVRVNSNLSMRFNLIWVVGCPRTKISLSEIQKSCIFPPSHPGKRGVRVVTNAGRDAVDAVVSRDERRNRGRRSRVVLAPRRWRYVLAGSNSCESNGGKRARSPGRARYKPLKTIAQGRPDDPAPPVATTVCLLPMHTGCGCALAPGLPCALLFSRDNVQA
jgi:hypothetical protein